MTKRQAQRLAKRIEKAGYRVNGYRHYADTRTWSVTVRDVDGSQIEVNSEQRWIDLYGGVMRA